MQKLEQEHIFYLFTTTFVTQCTGKRQISKENIQLLNGRPTRCLFTLAVQTVHLSEFSEKQKSIADNVFFEWSVLTASQVTLSEICAYAECHQRSTETLT